MASRLLLIAHSGALSPAEPRIPDPRDEGDPSALSTPIARRIQHAESGPEYRMVQTAETLGLTAQQENSWRERSYGEWAGATLAELDAASVRAWVAAPHVAPPGGESVADVRERIETRLSAGFADGLTAIVTSRDVLRAAVLVVTGAPDTAFATLDIAPLDAVELTINASRRAVRSIRPYPDWAQGPSRARE